VWRAASAATLALFAAAAARGATVTSTWKAGVTGNWNDATKWTNSPTTATFPNNGNLSNTYDVVLNSGTATLNVPIAVHNLTLGGGVIEATGTFQAPGTSAITLTGSFNFTSGTYHVPITVPSGSTLTLSPGAGKRIGNTLSVGGKVAFSGAGDVELYAERPARFNVASTGYFPLDRKLTLTNLPPDPFLTKDAYGTLQNSGTMVASAGAAVVTSGTWNFDNLGKLQVTAPFAMSGLPVRNLAGGLFDLTTATAAMTIDAPSYDASVELAGGMRLVAGSSLTLRAGTVSVEAPSVTNAGTITFATETHVAQATTIPGTVNFVTNTARLLLNANLALTGPAAFDNGAMISGTARLSASNLTLGASVVLNRADVNVVAGGALHLSASGSNRLIWSGRLTINGAADWAGNATGKLVADFDPARLEIGAAGSMDVRPSATASLERIDRGTVTAPDALANAGLLTVGDGGTFTVGKTWSMTNSGTLRVGAGTVEIATPALSSSGTIDLRPGAWLHDNTFGQGSTVARVDLLSSGRLTVASGATAWFEDGGSGNLLTNAGTVEVAGGRFLNWHWNVSNSGTFHVTDPAGRIYLAGPTLDNSGTIRADAGTLQIDTPSVTNRGVIELRTGAVGQFTPSGGATFTITAAGRMTVGGSATATFAGPSANGSLIANAGTVDVDHGRLTLNWSGSNTGVVRSEGGLIELSGTSYTNAGRIELAAGATLTARSTFRNAAAGVISIGPSATATFTPSDAMVNDGVIDVDHGQVTINSGTSFVNSGSVRVTSGAVKLYAGAFTNTGNIDLRAGGGAVISGTFNVNGIRAQILAGYHGGAWDGPGIRSASAAADPTTAVGYAVATGPGTFLGVSFAAGDILVRHTNSGDATLDGTVNFDDLLALAKSYNATGAHWYQGDFSYDGVVNFDDLLILAKNYNAAMPAADAVPGATAAFGADLAAAFAQVPEPSATLLTSAACGFALRRRRRKSR
jgi:hypothetical protein